MDKIERVIAANGTPAPPADLEERVLAAARHAAQSRARAPWWMRPAVRWAWAGLTVLLIAANVLTGVLPPSESGHAQELPVAVHDVRIDDPLLARALAISAAMRRAQLRPGGSELDVQRMIGGLS